MDRNDFEGIFKQFFPFGDSKKFADHVFNLFDTNQDGVVDFKEYMLLISLFTKGKIQDRIEWLFKMHDIDEDGYIGKAELLYLIQSCFACIQDILIQNNQELDPESRVDFLLKSVNSSDRMNREEFEKALLDSPFLTLFDGTLPM